MMKELLLAMAFLCVCSSVLVGKTLPGGALRIISVTVLARSAAGVLMKKFQ
jgi:hypothetical protein